MTKDQTETSTETEIVDEQAPDTLTVPSTDEPQAEPIAPEIADEVSEVENAEVEVEDAEVEVENAEVEDAIEEAVAEVEEPVAEATPETDQAEDEDGWLNASGAASMLALMTEEEIESEAERIGIRSDLLEEGNYTAAEYEEMLAMYEDTLSEIAEGEIVKAQVLRKTDNSVILDVGFKSEGAVPLDEFRNPEEIQPGDEVEVFLESLEDNQGVVVLSKKKADFLRVWEKIKEAFDNDETVPGVLKRKIKGGVTVDLMGVDAFLPGSQIALRRVPNVDELVGQTFDFKILKLNKRRRNIVVSRRVILEEERASKREVLKDDLQVGQVRKGVVKNITDFGAFIDLGGMDGLLHITDMSWGRIGHPSEITNIGDELEVKILDIDWDRERISLGLKQLMAYPWEDVAGKYPVGSRVRGRVVSITNYGAFIELEKGVEGLVHISEMSWTRNVRHPSQLVAINDEIECVVLRVDEEQKKISLGMKQTEEDPWLALPQKYPAGTKISGIVRNLTSFGAFVEVEPGIDGLVHISDMSWTRRVQHPSEVVRKGDEVEVVVLNIDPEQKRISLGLKQVDEDPWYELAQAYEPGTETNGEVVRLLDKGLVVDLGGDVEGFVPVSQLGIEEEVEDPGEYFNEGDKVSLKVLESDPINRRIVLSVLEVTEKAEPKVVEESDGEPAPGGDESAEYEDYEPAAKAEATAEEPEAEAEAEEPAAEAEAEEPAAEAEAEEPEAEAEAEEPEAEAEAEEPEAEAEAEEPAAEAEAEDAELKEKES